MSVRPALTLRRPRWGYQTSLFQTRRWAFWFLVAMLVVGGLVFAVEQTMLVGAAPAGWVLSWALLALYAVPVLFLVYVLDLFEKEPLSLVVGSVLWGAVVAASLSGIANEGWGLVVVGFGGPEFASNWGAALVAPFVEETLKTLGLVVLYQIAGSEFDDVMDGFVYGALVGLGFKLSEDVYYFVAEFGGTVDGVVGGFFVRVVLSGLYSHPLYTGLAGIGVAYFVTRRGEHSRKRRTSVGVLFFASAIAAHFLWNSPLLDLVGDTESLLRFMGTAALKGVPFLVFFVLMLSLARRRERRWLAAAFVGEEGGPGLLAGELAVLESRRRRRRACRDLRSRCGRRAARLLRRLHREQINLAMVRTREERDDHPDVLKQRDVCATVRHRIDELVTAR